MSPGTEMPRDIQQVNASLEATARNRYLANRKKTLSKFEALCRMFDGYTKLIPLTFLLGFYVSNVVSRYAHKDNLERKFKLYLEDSQIQNVM
ncbi:hypothetical protein ANCDUO_19228 [Ancylostoma duodenale]|uniref:Bestrophin homolog n=1 Tax=Ancylostoma duodenale TaxID=51022 RepID=A0A0C2FQ94_9BILA|nr:hypothetical protein ANCDUO_19228 [Ancylostoma duodenale]